MPHRTATPITCATRVVACASPFSSSCSVARPTGLVLQYLLVDRPGGVDVRVCQGAPVRAHGLGRCWVGMLFTPLRRAMAHMAGAAGSRIMGGAMVARDGVCARTASGDHTIDAVAGPFYPSPKGTPPPVASALPDTPTCTPMLSPSPSASLQAPALHTSVSPTPRPVLNHCATASHVVLGRGSVLGGKMLAV